MGELPRYEFNPEKENVDKNIQDSTVIFNGKLSRNTIKITWKRSYDFT